ncbi:sulfotransferase [Jatrophihabitans endophyticus]|uniref:sulfotransferase family protein n=1 Tax=Jatrophihabitans endophyticus TaxID=1206085 RepID=UPI0019F29D84|nr:sulfotransferase [Jatrophihabitans endophyticus]MBE7188968.1 sulfotransferase [Jatrophihabitans endophyticus]
MNDVRPIFLVGSARSGTTLLSVMLHAHPRIAMPPETRFLIPCYRNRANFGDLTVAANRRRLARRMTRPRSRFRDLGLDRRAVVQHIVNGPPTLGSAAGTVWRDFAHSRGKVRWGEKRPAYWQDMDVILRLFPDAQIIHLVRDGRACIASLKQVHWYGGSVIKAATTWSLAERELTRLGRKLPAGSYHRLRYEDLLADPADELGRLCSFLGEDFDEGMLAFNQAAGDIVPDRKTWHNRTKGDIDPARIEAWRTSLTPDEIGMLEGMIGRDLEARGYRRSGIGPKPSRSDVLTYHRWRAGRILDMNMRRWRDARQRREEKVPLADLG